MRLGEQTQSGAPLNKDWFLLGFTTGMAAAVAKSSVNWLAGKMGIPTTPYGVLAGNFVLGRREPRARKYRHQRRSIGDLWLGWLADVVFGGVFGAASSLVYTSTPPGNELAKGALAGAGLWALTFAIPNQMGIARMRPAEMGTVMVMDVLFGAFQGALIRRYGTKLRIQSRSMLGEMAEKAQFEPEPFGRRSTKPQF